jgi:methionyl-tRNA synthetase
VDYLNQVSKNSPIVFFVLFVWSLLWKGIALWNAVKNSQRNWFIAILVLNTVGILEIAYLFFFAKQKLTLKELRSLLRLGPKP